MEQYIYIFTIILEIIVCVQFSRAIIMLDKKVTKAADDVLLLKKEIETALCAFSSGIKKFNKISGFIVKAKRINIMRYAFFAADIISMIFLFKSFKTYRGLAKLKFLRKLFSYSLVRGMLSYLKSSI